MEKITNCNLYIAGFKGIKVFEECLTKEVKIHEIITYKNNLNSFYKSICILAKKNDIKLTKLTKKNIKTYFPKNKFINFFVGWQFLRKNLSNSIIFHDSLLPSYSGFTPTVSALINGEKTIGFTAFLPSLKIDTGQIIFQKEIKIKYPITIFEAYSKISVSVSNFIKNFFNFKAKKYIPKKKYKESFSIWRDKDDYFIDWTKSNSEIKRFIDALGFPYDNSKAIYNDKIVKISKCEIIKNKNIMNNSPGKILTIEKNIPIVLTGKGQIKILECAYIDSNKKVIFKNTRNKFK